MNRWTKLQFSAVANIPFPNDSTLLEKFEIYIRPLAATCLFTESAWPREFRANCLFICFILTGSTQERFYQSILVNLSKTLMSFKNSIAETPSNKSFQIMLFLAIQPLGNICKSILVSPAHSRDIINLKINLWNHCYLVWDNAEQEFKNSL